MLHLLKIGVLKRFASKVTYTFISDDKQFKEIKRLASNEIVSTGYDLSISTAHVPTLRLGK